MVSKSMRVLVAVILFEGSLQLAGCGLRGSDDSDTAGKPQVTETLSTAGAQALSGGLSSRPVNLTCVAPPQPKFGILVAITPIAPGLYFENPVQLLQAPAEDTRWYVVEQSGQVRTFVIGNDARTAADAGAGAEVFGDLTSRVDGSGETGLVALLFDPAFAANERVYIAYVARVPGPPAGFEARISRFKVSNGTIDPNSESILIHLPRDAGTRGLSMAFGPDGMLYAAFADGGGGTGTRNDAQTLDTLRGKVVRVDLRGNGPYTIPADNPFASAGASRCEAGSTAGGGKCGEVYAYGFHNPTGMSFEGSGKTSTLWLADSGERAREELNKVSRGGNYGWPWREGELCVSGGADCGKGATLVGPVATYPHSTGRSIVGGYVYHGTAIPWLANLYVFADRESRSLLALVPDADGELKVRRLTGKYSAEVDRIAQGRDGELYFVGAGGSLTTLSNGILKGQLSQTGCMDPTDPTKPGPGLIAYEVQPPFWSDGATKLRWMALPVGTRIKVDSSGHWIMPPGTVLIKDFFVAGKLIETRLLMRHLDTGSWGGYSYRWNARHTDADLVLEDEDGNVEEGVWTYMKRADCDLCHNAAVGGSIGLETRRMNVDLTYATSGRTANQLVSLVKIGMFADPLPIQNPYPNPLDDSLNVEARARSYLHANCAQCHRPGGPSAPAEHDLRFSTPMKNTKTCNMPELAPPVGVPGARLIVPGDPSRSAIYLRMTRRGDPSPQMPPLATHVVDKEGAALVGKWIKGMNGDCRWPRQTQTHQ